MKILKNAKISIKLTIIYAIMFSIVLFLLNASILYGVEYYLYSQATMQIEDTRKNIQDKIENDRQLSDFTSEENIYIKILDKDNSVISESKNFNYDIPIRESYNQLIKLEEQEKHLIFENSQIQSNQYGYLSIQVVKNMKTEYYFMKVLFGVMAIADFIGIIASIILGYFVSRKMLKPIDDITRTAQNISFQNLKERIDVKGPRDELKNLGETLNNMIDRLQESFQRQNQFVSDASHELRTPIAVIQGYANLIDRWGKDDREALEKAISGIKQETTNMISLVEKLLFLAKGDSNTIKIEKRKIKLQELICELVEESRLIDDRHKMTSSKNDDITVYADYKLIKQMLRIIIDNSIKFTEENGTIDIKSTLVGNTAKIVISDTGIGIPKNEIENIFNRFYMVDKSRSKENGGSGLGLSIAKEIAYMNGGNITAKSIEGKGTQIIVTLKLEK